MLELRPFEAHDAESVVTWFEDERAFHKWCANRFEHFPITAEELVEHYMQNGAPDLLYPLTAFDEDGIAGQLFLRFLDDEKTDVRFGFIVVSPDRRGKGYGSGMIRLALAYAFDTLKVNRVSLGVFDNNEGARRCYEAVGFRANGGGWDCDISGELWHCSEMELRAEDYRRATA